MKVHHMRTVLVGWALAVAPALHGQSTVVICDSNNPPYAIGKDDGHPPTGGTVVELVRRVFEEIDDAKVDIRLQPWLRCLAAARSGKVDGVLKLIPKPERAEYLDFTDPLYDSVQRFFYLKKSFPDGVHWETVADLAPYTLGVAEGSSYGPVVDEAIEKRIVRVESAMDDIVNFQKLLKGRIDLVPNNEVLARAGIEALDAVGLIVGTEQVTSSSPVCLGFSKSSSGKALIPKFNQALAKLKASGEAEAILSRGTSSP